MNKASCNWWEIESYQQLALIFICLKCSFIDHVVDYENDNIQKPRPDYFIIIHLCPSDDCTLQSDSMKQTYLETCYS